MNFLFITSWILVSPTWLINKRCLVPAPPFIPITFQTRKTIPIIKVQRQASIKCFSELVENAHSQIHWVIHSFIHSTKYLLRSYDELSSRIGARKIDFKDNKIK